MRKYLTGNGISRCRTTPAAMMAGQGAQLSLSGVRIAQWGDAYDCRPAAVRLAHLVEDSVALHQRA